MRDISERKRIELALQESEERFRLTVDEAPIGMALVGLDGHFVRVNRALSEIVGYTSTELTEITFQAITHPEDLDLDVSCQWSTCSWGNPPISPRKTLHPQEQNDRRRAAQRFDSSRVDMAHLSTSSRRSKTSQSASMPRTRCADLSFNTAR